LKVLFVVVYAINSGFCAVHSLARMTLGDVAQARHLIDTVAESFGGLDILVCNAGVAMAGLIDGPQASIDEMTRMYDVNLHGVIASMRAAARVIRDHGRIIVEPNCTQSMASST
jgi:NAD(P)-dependent dehydrogenase (short-subunit alcohol dehydrogenase family)